MKINVISCIQRHACRSLAYAAVWLLGCASAWAATNVAPTVNILSAAMRPDSRYMDVTYRIDDPDDATVKVRALAFKDGVRSFSNVVRVATLVEGTATNIGDTIPTGVTNTLTWDVASDWNIVFGQVKFEVMCRDSRGLLPFDFIAIPATNGHEAISISKDAPTDAQALDALFWLWADGDAEVTLTNGALKVAQGVNGFFGYELASNATIKTYAVPFLMKRMNLQPTDKESVNYALVNARAGLVNTNRWHAYNQPYEGMPIIRPWGRNDNGQCNVPAMISSAMIAVGVGFYHSLALQEGQVTAWGGNSQGQCNVPAAASNPATIVGGYCNSYAIRPDGRVVAWGYNTYGACNVPPDASNSVVAVSADDFHCLALRSDGRVVAWGWNANGQCNVPPDGSNSVIAVGTGYKFSMALRTNGQVVVWGGNDYGQTNVPAGLSNVTAIAGGNRHCLALKSDGTVTAWGANDGGQCNVPAGLSNVTAIAAGELHNLALKGNGTVTAWGTNDYGQCNVPAGLSNVTAIVAGESHNLAVIQAGP